MSNFSVYNFSRLSNGFNQQSTDLPRSVDNNAGEKPVHTTSAVLRNNPAVASEGTVTLSKDALEKLLEMFEHAFKAIRNMLSGQGEMPKLIPDAGLQPKPGKDGGAQMKDKAGTQSEVLNTALKDSAVPNPEVSARKDKPANNPAVPNSTLNVTPKPQALTEFRLRESTLHEDVQLNNKSNSDVNVTVQVNCHCPHPDAPKPRAPVRPKPDAPHAPIPPRLDAPIPSKLDAPVSPKPDAPILPKPDTPTPDVTAPGPAKDDFELETTGRRRAYANDWRSNPDRRTSR